MPKLTAPIAAGFALLLFILTTVPAGAAEPVPPTPFNPNAGPTYVQTLIPQPTVTQFDIDDLGHIRVDVIVPTNTQGGALWAFYRSDFPAGGFDTQSPVRRLLDPGEHFTLDDDATDVCAQIDLVDIAHTDQPHAADLTQHDVCQPGFHVPTSPPVVLLPPVVPDAPPAPPVAPPAPPVAPPVTPDVPTEQASPPTTELTPAQPEQPETPAQPETPTTEAPEAPTTTAAGQDIGVSAAEGSLPLTGSTTWPLITLALTLAALGFIARIPHWVKRRDAARQGLR